MNGRRLAALALLGGISSLGSETLYFKILDATVGSAPLTSNVVVASFILAMGIGGAFSARVRRFAWIELALGVFHLSLALGLPVLLALNGRVLEALSPLVGPTWAASMLGFALTVPPAFLLGVGLPAVIERSGELPRPYLLHALGAAGAVVAFEWLVLPTVGLPGALIAVAAVHFTAAWLFGKEAVTTSRLAIGRPVWALGIAGVATGAIQGGWLFIAELDVGPFYFVSPMVVLSMLIGLCLGSLLARQVGLCFGHAIVAIIAGIAVSTGALVAFSGTPRPASTVAACVELLLTILPSAIPIGALVPAYFGRRAIDRDQAGAANLSVSVGNVLGLALAGVVLSPRVPIPYLLIAPLLLLLPVLKNRWLFGLAVAGISTSALLATRLDETGILARTAGLPVAEVTVDRFFRAPGELAAIYRAPTRRLYQNGYHPIDIDQQAESVISVVGASYSARYDRALVIGAGSGRSAGTAALVFKEVDVLDVSPLTPALLEALASDNERVLFAPHVRLRTIDGILAPHVLRPGYDLIVLTVDPGFCARAAKLYTVEALAGLGSLLAPGGVLIFWGDAELSPEANQILLNSGKAAFAHQKVFAALTHGRDPPSYFFFVQSKAPLRWAPGWLKLRFAHDLAVRALPGLGGYGEGVLPGGLPEGFVPPTEAAAADLPEADRLITRPFSSTSQVHRIARPARALLDSRR